MKTNIPFLVINQLWPSLGIAMILVLIWEVVLAFHSTSYYGTAGAPYLDALLWLEGGLSFLFDLQPPNYLYRPTIGIFWSSILAATGQVKMIPIFFICSLFAFVAAALFLVRDYSLRKALILWLVVSAGSFQTWFDLNIASTNLDLASFAFTITGVILLLVDTGGTPVRVRALIVGSLCLGIAAAVRGPMIFGGGIMILMRLAMIARYRLRIGFVICLVFFAPFILDVALQRYFGAINNGFMGLFCVYYDPSHTWTFPCHSEYLKRQPSGGEVLDGYVQFLFTAKSGWFLFENATLRILQDFAPLQHTAILLLLLLGGVFSFLTGNNSGHFDSTDKWGLQTSTWCATDGMQIRRWPTLHKTLLVVCSLLIVKWSSGDILRAGLPIFSAATAAGKLRWSSGDILWAAIPLVWLSLAFGASLRLRYWRPLMCFSGYIAGTAFLTLIGLTFDRLQSTFSFLLYLGVALLITESYSSLAPVAGNQKNAGESLSWGVLVTIIFLYAGNFLFSSNLRNTYKREVYGHHIAMKLSDDASLDRSLYYTGDRKIIYTHYDELPIGAVRGYSRLALDTIIDNCPLNFNGNGSYLHPNTFVE